MRSKASDITTKAPGKTMEESILSLQTTAYRTQETPSELFSRGTHRSSKDIRGQPEVSGSHDNEIVEDGGRIVRIGHV